MFQHVNEASQKSTSKSQATQHHEPTGFLWDLWAHFCNTHHTGLFFYFSPWSKTFTSSSTSTLPIWRRLMGASCHCKHSTGWVMGGPGNTMSRSNCSATREWLDILKMALLSLSILLAVIDLFNMYLFGWGNYYDKKNMSCPPSSWGKAVIWKSKLHNWKTVCQLHF